MSLLGPRVLERLSRLDLRARRAAGGRGQGERVAGAAGVGSIFREHRAYAPGDDLRYVDWNVFARHRSVHVKVFEHEENLDVLLLVDVTASMGAGPDSKLEAACRTAAIVGVVALQRGADVRLCPLPGGGERRFRGPGAVRPLLAALASLQSGSTDGLGELLEEALPAARRRGLAILLTDFLEPPEVAVGWRGAVDRLLSRRVELVGVQFVAPEERAPTDSGPLRLVDRETGEQVDVQLDERTRAEYRKRFSRHVRDIRRRLNSRGARHLILASEEAREFALLHALVRGGVLA